MFVGKKAIELDRKDDRTWTPVQRPYVLRLLITCAHRNLCVYRDISPTSQVRVEIVMKSGHLPWATKDQNVKEIGLQTLFNEYWTSKKHEITLLGRSSSPTISLVPDRRRRGYRCGKISLQFQSVLLCEPYCLFLSSLPSNLADYTRIGGTYSLAARRTRRIVVNGTLPYDGCTDREGGGQSYQIRVCFRRGPFLPNRNHREIDPFQLNPVAKAVFGLAGVTFEVRARC